MLFIGPINPGFVGIVKGGFQVLVVQHPPSLPKKLRKNPFKKRMSSIVGLMIELVLSSQFRFI
jgi:hypothetical protein